MAVLPGGDVIVGGDFTTAGGVPANRIARYNPTTGVWSALGSGTNNFVVSALAVLPGGDVIVGGDFSLAGGVPANNIARYNPTTGVWSALGAGTNSSVFALAMLPGGDVIAGGNFTTAGGVPASNIARYTFGAPAPTITTQPAPQTLCAAEAATFSIAITGGTGPFTYQWRKGGVAIDTLANPSASTPTLTLTSVTPADAGSYDCVVSVQCGSTTSNAATLTVLAPCPCGPADIAGPGGSVGADGELTADDILRFVGAFTAQNLAVADVAGPGPSLIRDGELTADDIILFVIWFFEGC